MKRIKQIIESLRVISRTPSKAIVQAGAVVIAAASKYAESQNWTDDSAEAHRLATSIDLVENILCGVSLIAEDMEKPAKPAATETA